MACMDCKREPCGCNYTPVKNSVMEIRCFKLRNHGMVKYWPKTKIWDGKTEVHLRVAPGEFPELDQLLERLIQTEGHLEEHL